VSVIPDRVQAGPGEVWATRFAPRMPMASGDAEVSSFERPVGACADGSIALPIEDFFYSERGLSVRTSVPIVNSIEYYNAELAARRRQPRRRKGSYSGGGKGEGDNGVMQIREKFLDTAYWNASVATLGGEATVSVTLRIPDHLAHGCTGSYRGYTRGANHERYHFYRPLLVRPQTPRFFVAGDEVQLAPPFTQYRTGSRSAGYFTGSRGRSAVGWLAGSGYSRSPAGHT